MAMRLDWVDAIFARLELAYGQRFAQQWGAVPAASVKAAWASELDGIGSRGIAHALAHLHADYPPNAMQFKALCLAAPGLADTTKRLEGPAPTAANVARVARATEVLRKPRDPRAWAHALKAREESGERLSRVQREAWRTALHRIADTSNDAGSSSIAA